MTQAIEDLRQAISLRSGDYGLWTQLGQVLENKGDSISALAAFTEAQRLAPSYGSTCWNVGMSLVNQARLEEGFRQLRDATLRKPDQFPQVMELAWAKYNGNVLAVQRALEPGNNEERIELVGFLIKNAQPDESPESCLADGKA